MNFSFSQLSLSLTIPYKILYLAIFYCPLSCPDHLDLLLSALAAILPSQSQFSTQKLVLLGDFNYTTSSPLLDKVHAISVLFSLNRVVLQPTHYSHTGTPTTIDWFLSLPHSNQSNVWLHLLSLQPITTLSYSHSPSILGLTQILLAPLVVSGCMTLPILLRRISLSLQFPGALFSFILTKKLLGQYSKSSSCVYIMHKTIPSEIVYSPSHPTPPYVPNTLMHYIKMRNLIF